MASETREKMRQAIADLRTALPECDLALVADAGTGLVLHADADKAPSQDALERVVEGGIADLAAPWTAATAQGDAPLRAARLDADGWTVTLRPAGSEDILVCRCAAAPDAGTLTGAARAVFDTLDQAEGK